MLKCENKSMYKNKKKKLFFSISIMLAIISIFKCSSNETNIGKLMIKDGLYLAKEYQILSTIKNNPKIDGKSKICVITSREEYENLCKPFAKIYYDKWLIHTSNVTAISEIMNFIINGQDSYDLNIQSILIPNSIDTSAWSENHFAILSISLADFEDFKIYDFRNEYENYFSFIKYDKTISNEPWAFYRYSSIIGFFLCLMVIVIWHFWTFKKYKDFSTPLQKTLSALPYIATVYSLCIFDYYKTLENIDTSDDPSISIKSYLVTILITLGSIYRTVYWFLVIIVSYGWQIYKFNLTRQEMRKFIGIYIFIYLSVCFDEIMNSIISRTFYGFSISEIKNMIIYIVFTGIILTKGLASLKIINGKLSYARSLAREFVPGLELKASLMKYHMSFAVVYIILYISMLFCVRLIMKSFKMNYLITIALYLFDALFMIFLLMIHRSRVFPAYYTLDLYSTDDEQEVNVDIKVLTVKIPKISKIKTADDNNFVGFMENINKNQKKDLLDNNTRIPLIIINPIFDSENIQNENEPNMDNIQGNRSNQDNFRSFVNRRNNNISDKLSIGFIV